MQQSEQEPDVARMITPEGFNIRTRVHEYGGRCHVIDDDYVYFVNFDDQLLYRQSLHGDAQPQPMTERTDEGWMLADPLVVDARWLVFVGERKRDGHENVNALVALDRLAPAPVELTVIAEGEDFYASPVVSADASQLAFVGWNHPDMPWDSAKLYLAQIDQSDASFGLTDLRPVAGGCDESVCQPVFRRNGDLVFAMDSESKDYSHGGNPDFWNLYSFQAGSGAADPETVKLTADDAEYGAAHWVFGNRRLVEVDQDRLVAVRTGANGDNLVVVDSQGVSIIDSQAVRFSSLSVANLDGEQKVFAVAEYLDRESCVVEFDPATKTIIDIEIGSRAIAADANSAPSVLAADQLSKPEQISVSTRDGKQTYAWLYEPSNPQFEGPKNSQPPLMVLVHGGPTSRAEPSFDLSRQYWTSRGFAVADINHRGSTGFGRGYRQALRGGWGEVDVDDIADVVAHLVQIGKVDRRRVIIRGGSAGGYAVLRALTRHPQVFCAGACYYGIGNLTTLARSTHKFESRYLDGLLGEPFDESRAEDKNYVYYQRSPINFIADLANPMILFQGSEDRVVPPQVSREVVAVLTQRGLKHDYIEYEGEGHGFRKAENRIDALTRETEFMTTVLSALS